MYLHLAEHRTPKEHYKKAWEAFAQVITVQPLHQRGRSEVTIDQASAARGLGDVVIFAEHLRKGVELAVTLKSQRRYQEAITVYSHTPENWLVEREIRMLANDVFAGQLPSRGERA